MTTYQRSSEDYHETNSNRLKNLQLFTFDAFKIINLCSEKYYVEIVFHLKNQCGCKL